ncbi:hypothetical protein GWK47_007861 [Chionoecetes opilio]|uniref:Uncharacterized protein n=1 Tax=Chionoecetes opilio TaxID=41210 RepID=A0A8J4YB35_CHIOP|nr:hypothetical protein GWK47_007861 [Chionoecetes opilio]
MSLFQKLSFFPEIDHKPAASTQVQKNYDEISNIALASVRYGIGLRPTAAIATAALIDAGIITEDNTSKVIDKSKVKRAQEKLMRELGQEFEEKCREDGGISCILFDRRTDLTNVMMEAEGSDQSFPAMIKEEHYSAVSEPGSYYLFHFIPEKATKEESHAEKFAKIMFAWLKERGFDKTLLAIGGDSTNVNTGVKAGVMRKLELHLGRKLVWLVCNLHTGELPLRHFIVGLDGPTLSDKQLSGLIGKLLDSATDFEINPNFTRISVGPPLIKLPDKGWSASCREALHLLLEIGPVNYSRWLTTANRLIRLWVSKHELKGKNLKNLHCIVEFIIGVYYPYWFNVKVKHSWIEGPRYILFQLDCLKSQRKEVLDIVMPTVKRSVWYAHSEAILQTMLCSEDQKERFWGVERILAIRGDGDPDAQLGDSIVRTRRTPDINCDASSIGDLISWSEDVSEPPLTCSLSTSEVKNFVNTPMEVLNWPCHTQSIERVIKMVTEASAKYFSHEKRDEGIRAQETSRGLMSKNELKQDLCSLAKFKKCMMTSTRERAWWLIGHPECEITRARLPSKGQVLRKFYFHHGIEKKTKPVAAKEVIEAVLLIWGRAGIPTSALRTAKEKLLSLVAKYESLQKHRKRASETARMRNVGMETLDVGSGALDDDLERTKPLFAAEQRSLG